MHHSMTSAVITVFSPSLTQPEGREVPHKVHSGLGPSGYQPQGQIGSSRQHWAWWAFATQWLADRGRRFIPTIVELDVGASMAGVRHTLPWSGLHFCFGSGGARQWLTLGGFGWEGHWAEGRHP